MSTLFGPRVTVSEGAVRWPADRLPNADVDAVARAFLADAPGAPFFTYGYAAVHFSRFVKPDGAEVATAQRLAVKQQRPDGHYAFETGQWYAVNEAPICLSDKTSVDGLPAGAADETRLCLSWVGQRGRLRFRVVPGEVPKGSSMLLTRPATFFGRVESDAFRYYRVKPAKTQGRPPSPERASVLPSRDAVGLPREEDGTSDFAVTCHVSGWGDSRLLVAVRRLNDAWCIGDLDTDIQEEAALAGSAAAAVSRLGIIARVRSVTGLEAREGQPRCTLQAEVLAVKLPAAEIWLSPCGLLADISARFRRSETAAWQALEGQTVRAEMTRAGGELFVCGPQRDAGTAIVPAGPRLRVLEDALVGGRVAGAQRSELRDGLAFVREPLAYSGVKAFEGPVTCSCYTDNDTWNESGRLQVTAAWAAPTAWPWMNAESARVQLCSGLYYDGATLLVLKPSERPRCTGDYPSRLAFLSDVMRLALPRQMDLRPTAKPRAPAAGGQGGESSAASSKSELVIARASVRNLLREAADGTFPGGAAPQYQATAYLFRGFFVLMMDDVVANKMPIWVCFVCPGNAKYAVANDRDKQVIVAMAAYTYMWSHAQADLTGLVYEPQKPLSVWSAEHASAYDLQGFEPLKAVVGPDALLGDYIGLEGVFVASAIDNNGFNRVSSNPASFDRWLSRFADLSDEEKLARIKHNRTDKVNQRTSRENRARRAAQAVAEESAAATEVLADLSDEDFNFSEDGDAGNDAEEPPELDDE